MCCAGFNETRQNYQRSSLAGDKKIVGSVMQITTSASQAETKNKANKNKRILIHKKVNKIQHIFFVIFNILNKKITDLILYLFTAFAMLQEKNSRTACNLCIKLIYSKILSQKSIDH